MRFGIDQRAETVSYWLSGIWVRKACGLGIGLLVLTPVPTLGQSSAEIRVHMAPDWQHRIDACFDTCGNVNTDLLNRFVRDAELSRVQSPAGTVAQETAAPESMLADAYMQQGRLDDARALLSLTRFRVDNSGHASPFPSTLEYKVWSAYRLAAIAVAERHYSVAARLYFCWICYRLWYAALQPVILAALVLLLWKLKPGAKFCASRRDYVSVIALSCIPVWKSLFSAVAWPLNSLVLFGNAGKSTIDHRCTFVATGLYHVEFLLILLAVAVLVNRRRSMLSQGTDTQVQETEAAIPRIQQQFMGRRSARLLALVIFGTILAGGQRFEPSSVIWYPHQIHISDAWWWVSVIAAIVAAPICEEAFFRGSLYRLARRTMDPLFGAALSAIAFAGYHLEPARFPTLVWAGIALAILYEIKKSIWLPAAAHGLYNLFARW
jgi:hypothetical protein